MRFTVMNARSAVVVRLAGSLSVGAELGSLHAAVAGVADGRVRGVYLDLAGMTRLDCWGIGELLRLRGRVVDGRRAFGLINVDARSRRLLDMARLTSVLGVQDPMDARLMAGPAGSAGGAEPPPAAPRLVRFHTSRIGASHECRAVALG